MIIAVDFDGTTAFEAFPNVGDPDWNVINDLLQYKKWGHTLILWTCREGKKLDEALEACKSCGLEFDYINENTPEQNERYGNDSRKVGADFYLDDKAVNVRDIKTLTKILKPKETPTELDLNYGFYDSPAFDTTRMPNEE